MPDMLLTASVNIKWVDSETVTDENAAEVFGDVSMESLFRVDLEAVVLKGKFLLSVMHVKTTFHSLVFALGMQLSIVEFARHVVGFRDAHSVELNSATTHPVISLMADQEGVDNIGGTLRLGSYPCKLAKDSLAYKLYKEELIHERHRHRYEVNNDYRKDLTNNGMMLSGISPDGRIVEMVEIPSHPFFIATQAHPEFKSRPNRPHPLFLGFVNASLDNQNK